VRMEHPRLVAGQQHLNSQPGLNALAPGLFSLAPSKKDIIPPPAIRDI
jgi:hypothetical protein